MSKRPNSDHPTTAKRPRKASGFRLARPGLADPVQSSSSSSSSRFVTLSENPGGRGALRARNRLLHRSSEPSSSSKSQSHDAEFHDSDTTLQVGLEEAAQHEVQPDTGHTTPGKRKRKQKTSVSDVSIF
jgi:hypothetical protein